MVKKTTTTTDVQLKEEYPFLELQVHCKYVRQYKGLMKVLKDWFWLGAIWKTKYPQECRNIQILWLLSDFSFIYVCYLYLSSLRLRGIYYEPQPVPLLFLLVRLFHEDTKFQVIWSSGRSSVSSSGYYKEFQCAVWHSEMQIPQPVCESVPQSWFIVFQWAVPTLLRLQGLYLFEVFLSSYHLSRRSTQEHRKICSTYICQATTSVFPMSIFSTYTLKLTLLIYKIGITIKFTITIVLLPTIQQVLAQNVRNRYFSCNNE